MPREAPNSRARSRSPYPLSHNHHDRHRPGRDRSRSPRSHHQHRRHTHKDSDIPVVSVKLPFRARSLSRHDLGSYRPMFALYLDIQKNILVEDLTEGEVKGRWKSFIGKWNDGKLAEGWYDPHTLEKAIESYTVTSSGETNIISTGYRQPDAKQAGQGSSTEPKVTGQAEAEDDNDDDSFGPTLPQLEPDLSGAKTLTRAGPSIPKFHDLQHARELAAEDALISHRQASKDLRIDRKSEQAVRMSHLDEVVPRAEPGTRERQLEKRRELATSNRAFASAKTDPTDVDLPEADVMGGEGGLSELKRLKEMEERKRTEREVRREEVMRAKREEREGRMREMKQKEDKTMEMLREIARARFGGDGVGPTGAVG